MDSLYLTTESSAPRKYKRPNTLVQRDPSDPIVRRAFHASIVRENHLYIVGGDVSKASAPGANVYANDTFAIDLEESWTNTSVQIKSTPPGGSSRAPVLNLQALWPGEDSNGSGTFYSVGGKPSQPWFDPQYSNTLNVPNALSRCQTSKQGEADWSVVPSDMSSNFPSSRTVQGASAAGAGRGFYLGGLQGDVNAGCRFDCRTPVTPGMLIYDVAKNQWSNVSTERLPSEAVVGGRMHFVPNFGQEGVLVALGGQIRSPTTRDIQSFWPYSTIMVYDIAGGRWYQQPAAGTPQGEIPAPRFSPCIAGARSNDGSPNSYEMYAHFLLPDAVGGNCHAATDTSKRFLYGGGNVLYGSGDQTKDHNDTIPDGSVWILSLPSFSWLKANDTSGTKRMGHTCEVGGSRQMISVGGLAPDPPMRTDGYAAFAQEDPLSNGIGVFDMVDLVWKDSYDAKASPYLKPPAVSSLYSKELAVESVPWSDPALRELFLNPGSQSGSSPNSLSSSSASNLAHPRPVGATVGIVLGSISAVALLSFAIFYIIRRRRRKATLGADTFEKEADSHFPPMHRAGGKGRGLFSRGSPKKEDELRAEMGSDGSWTPPRPSELGANQVHEMYAGWGSELFGSKSWSEQGELATH